MTGSFRFSKTRQNGKPEVCFQTVVPYRSILIKQKLAENAKIQKYKCDILNNFQTMCAKPKVQFFNTEKNMRKSVKFFMFCFAKVNLEVQTQT